MNILSVAIIGVGRVGGALALALSKKGYVISQLVARSHEKAEKIAALIDPRPQIIGAKELEKVTADIVFITTQDSEIYPVAESLVERLEHLPYIFHTSGALSSKILRSLCDEGCEVASIHPLVSISTAETGATRFKNSYFCIEGDPDALEIARQIVEDLEGRAFSIETKYKTLYHAAAVTACGHLVALISAAVEMLAGCGVGASEAQKILLPLIDSTIQNLAAQTPAESLTGPFARADAATVERHLHALAVNSSPELIQIYRILGLRSLPLARAQGANAEKLRRVEKILNGNS